MADSGNPNDPLSSEYRRRLKEGPNYVPPAQRVQEGASSAPSMAPTPVPAGQEQGEDSILRGAGIAANQFGIGLLGIPASALHYGMDLGHYLDPQFPASPAWSHATGPGSYGDYLTINALTPHTPSERVLAAGARTAGTAATLMPFGLGPVAAGINVAGSMGGQTLREAGHPTAGDIVDVATGVGTGLGTAARAVPNVGRLATGLRNRLMGAPAVDEEAEALLGPGWTNVAPSGTQTAREAAVDAQHEELMRYLRMSPIYHNPFSIGSYVGALMAHGVGRIGPSSATSAAQRILGIGMGATVGGVSAAEAPNAPINYAAPGQPPQPPGVTWTPPPQ
jgi:hypothetical protein